jgi:hypothetical protein
VLLCHDAIVLLVLYSLPLVLEPSSTVLALVRTTVVAEKTKCYELFCSALFCAGGHGVDSVHDQ